MATASTAAAPAAQTIAPTPVPFRITTQPDGYLPDMKGFTLQRLGSLEKGWHSLCPIEGGRDLIKGEVISACQVRERDGEMVRVDYTAIEGTLKKDQWPQAFAKYIVEHGKGLSAGGWNAQGGLTCEGTEQLRLWCRNPFRAFSTAPFASNLVQALACDDQYALANGQSLCLQVRDLNTQHLYEHHVFMPSSAQTGKAWSKALCEQINRDSQLVRAGVLDANACAVAPAAKGNAFWVGQCARLSVTLAEVNWWPAQVLEGAQPLTGGQPLQAWAYDAYSHRLLDSFSWTPTEAQAKANNWLEAWATALNQSPLGRWLCASAEQPTGAATGLAKAKQLTLWQRGEGVRVFTSLPGADNWVAGPRLGSVWNTANDAVLITLRHPFSRQLLGHEVFLAKGLADQGAWEGALAKAIGDKQWPELRVGREGPDGQLTEGDAGQGAWHAWQPRYAGLLIELKNLGDSSTWSTGRLGKYLLDTDVSGSKTTTSLLSLSQVEASTRSYREGCALLYITKCSHELVFRLSTEARAKGYRVADCYRETSTTYASKFAKSDIAVRSVTSDTITWGKGRGRAAFKLVLDYPDTSRDATQLTVGHVGYLDDHYLWRNLTEVKFTPPAALEPYAPSSPLCEDYGNTLGSEVFDAGGESETGVDSRTGMFHAHFPVATLQGLAGRGPVCELTLHYSALRGNEGGLGDGWAWRFASLDTRDRRLTLADGMTITFTDEEWTQLGNGARLEKQPCFIRSNKDHSQFTLDLPSGRQEILSKPAAPGSDEIEPNDEFRQEVIRLFKAIKAKSKPEFPAKLSGATQRALAVICPLGYTAGAAADYNAALKAWKGKTKEIDEHIAYYQRPFAQLLPSSIVSPYGESLALSWKRQQGQFLLVKVSSGEVELFKASYSPAEVTMEIWPTSAQETFKLTLRLEDYLLRTFKRTQGESEALQVLQQVDCDYAQDPTLDRVLYRLQELDGSVERVEWEAKAVAFSDGRPALPRVDRHVLIPGGGAENTVVGFSYKGSFVENAIYAVTTHSQGMKQSKRYTRKGEMISNARSSVGRLDISFQKDSKSSGEIVNLAIALQKGLEFRNFFKGVEDQLESLSFFLKEKDIEATAARFDKVVALWAEREADHATWAEARADDYYHVDRKRLWSWLRGTAHYQTSVFYAEEEYKFEEAMSEEEMFEEAKPASASLDFGVRSYELLLMKSLFSAVGKRVGAEVMTLNRFELIWLLSLEQLRRQSELEDHELLAVLETSDMAGLSTNEEKRAAVESYQLFRSIGRWLQLQDDSSWNKGGFFAFAEMVRGLEFVHDNPDFLPSNDAQGENFFELHKQQIQYTSAHTVQKITTSDGHTTHRCYYDGKGSNTLVPALIKDFKDFPHLSCPAIPPEAAAPLMAEYQCDAHGNPLGLTLYGYRSVKRNERHLLEASHIVTVEGLKATLTDDTFDASTAWAMADPNQNALWRVRNTTTSEPTAKTNNEGCKVSTWAITDIQTTAVGDQRLQVTTVQQFEDNPSSTYAGLQVSTTVTTAAGTELVSREIRSRFSRRCLSKTAREVETHFRRDGLGRVVEQTRYRFKPNGIRDDASKSSTATAFAIEQDSLTALTTLPNGSQHRDWLDGLQRVVRSELRRTPSDPFVPLLHKVLRGTADDDPLVDQEWDYLPGGQALCEPLQSVQLPGQQAWSRDLLDSAGTVERGLGAQTLLRSTSTLETLANGHLTRRETLASTTGIERAGVLREFDVNGRLIRLTQTVDGTAREHVLTRDELGRVTRQDRPDGYSVLRTYHGMSTHVTELRVCKHGEAASAGQLIATQDVDSLSTLGKRKVGTRQYRFEGDNVTLPDNTQLNLSETREGGTYQAGTETLSSVSRSGAVTTLASDGEAQQGSELKAGPWQYSLTASLLPGQQRLNETTLRGQRQGSHWQTLRGVTVASLRADGHWERSFVDHDGRLLRSWHDHQDVVHRHDDHGRLVERRVQATQANAQWQVNSDYDLFGQEIQRAFSHNGKPVFAQQLQWRSDGQLLAKHSGQPGKQVRSERFDYDSLDRLIAYTCEADTDQYRPRTEQGKPVKAQRFEWDALSNLKTCTTTHADDTKRTQVFTYDADNPTRLKAVTTDGASVELTHNANGYQTTDGHKRVLGYNAGGQLTQVSDADGCVRSRYAYDGYQRLAAQYVAEDASTRELRYAGDTLIGEDWFDTAGKLTRQRSIAPGLAEYEANAVSWLIDDPQCGVAGQFNQAGLQLTPLLPFGEGKTLTGLGYNGMRRDPVTGDYHAGNGYRCYDPSLYRHAQPDWRSPFGEGGINDYVYCPDPVNLHDPSGAIMLSRWGRQSGILASVEQSLRDTQPFPVGSRWRGIAFSAALTVIGFGASILTGGTASMLVFAALTTLSVASLGLEIAAVLVEDSDPKLARKLSIASTVTGVLSIGNFAGAFKQAANLLRSAARVSARLLKGAVKMGWRVLLKWGSSGFVKTYRYLRDASKAAKAAQASARAATRVSQAKVTDVLGDLITPKFAVVESDAVQKLLTGNRYQLLTGWQAKLPAKVTQMPEFVRTMAETVETADQAQEIFG
ncbi:RHS repeat-associated core domain-containing protein [Pseudomonas sp. RIT-PI-S]|uniref:RHS repeat-associated core domain-containing protein n=1 Tax=Pseudomonas sp. RIT-PI-S TaxID=3035295 RepID=UPI0021D87C43|nr:RHS repeat-associated core domain-containing protein [Pseudomonas sp. RIT-PI-S]